MHEVATVVLEGGDGERLGALTREHCKGTITFGGIYRIVDIPMSNCSFFNPASYRICVLAQHKGRTPAPCATEVVK